MTTPAHPYRPGIWPMRAAFALTTFLFVSGIVMMALPQFGDQFLGMVNPTASPARTAMIGIRQLEYGILLLFLLRSGAYRGAVLAIRIGGLIPLVDAGIAYTQTGIHPALPHICAAVGAQVLAYAMAGQASSRSLARDSTAS